MNDATPSLFPVPVVPAASAGEVQLACTAATLTQNQLIAALARGGWSEEGIAAIGRMIAASKAIREQLRAMLVPPGGKR